MEKNIKNTSSKRFSKTFWNDELQNEISKMIDEIADPHYYVVTLQGDQVEVAITLKIEHKIHKMGISTTFGAGFLILNSDVNSVVDYIKSRICEGMEFLHHDIDNKINTLQKIKNCINHEKV